MNKLVYVESKSEYFFVFLNPNDIGGGQVELCEAKFSDKCLCSHHNKKKPWLNLSPPPPPIKLRSILAQYGKG